MRHKNNKNHDGDEDKKTIKSKGKRKKRQRKSKRHFDKEALRGIIDGTVDVDAYEDYIDGPQ